MQIQMPTGWGWDASARVTFDVPDDATPAQVLDAAIAEATLYGATGELIVALLSHAGFEVRRRGAPDPDTHHGHVSTLPRPPVVGEEEWPGSAAKYSPQFLRSVGALWGIEDEAKQRVHRLTDQLGVAQRDLNNVQREIARRPGVGS